MSLPDSDRRDDAGRPGPASKYAKFRQINRFLELVDDVADHLPPTGVLRVVDFGCGKSYLTFALHHFLTNLRHRDVDILGLDRRTRRRRRLPRDWPRNLAVGASSSASAR